MKRSSNARIWKEARTRIAISLSEWPLRWSCSISSPTARASSSRVPDRGDARPCRPSRPTSVKQRLAEPALVVGDEVRGGARGCGRSSGSCARAGSPWRRENPSRSGGCCRPRRRASRRSTGRRRRRSRCCLLALREQPQPEILGDVGVLVLVDQHVAEAALVVGEHVGVLAEEPQALEQQVAEVGGVQRLQPLLVGGVELLAACRWRRRGRRPSGTSSGDSPRFFQPSIMPGELARRPALLVDVRRRR